MLIHDQMFYSEVTVVYIVNYKYIGSKLKEKTPGRVNILSQRKN